MSTDKKGFQARMVLVDDTWQFEAERSNSVRVHNHAVVRYKQRTGAKYSDEKVALRIAHMYYTGRPAVFSDNHFAALALINHDLEKAEYRTYETFVLVCIDKVVKTLHENEAKRWKETPEGDKCKCPIERLVLVEIRTDSVIVQCSGCGNKRVVKKQETV